MPTRRSVAPSPQQARNPADSSSGPELGIRSRRPGTRRGGAGLLAPAERLGARLASQPRARQSPKRRASQRIRASSSCSCARRRPRTPALPVAPLLPNRRSTPRRRPIRDPSRSRLRRPSHRPACRPQVLRDGRSSCYRDRSRGLPAASLPRHGRNSRRRSPIAPCTGVAPGRGRAKPGGAPQGRSPGFGCARDDSSDSENVSTPRLLRFFRVNRPKVHQYQAGV